MQKLTLSTLFLILALAASAMADGTFISGGNISGTWTKAGSPYTINGDVTIPSGQSLTIERGVTVYFAGHYKFTVNGKLDAVGREKRLLNLGRDDKDVVRFTTDLDKNSSGWAGLRLVHSEDGTRLENCVIEFGRATGDSADGMGGGIYIEGCDPDIANCSIVHCSATGPGGGVACVNGTADLANCSISDNSSLKLGGGVYVSGGTGDLANCSIDKNFGGGVAAENQAKVDLANCSIGNNTGDVQGGGLHLSASTVDIANVSFSENSKGGLALLDGSKADISNCTIHGNTGADKGGGIFSSGSDLDVTNCVVNNNSTGGIFLSGKCQVDLTNCAISGNGGGSAIVKDGESAVETTNCEIKD